MSANLNVPSSHYRNSSAAATKASTGVENEHRLNPPFPSTFSLLPCSSGPLCRLLQRKKSSHGCFVNPRTRRPRKHCFELLRCVKIPTAGAAFGKLKIFIPWRRVRACKFTRTLTTAALLFLRSLFYTLILSK